MPRTAPSNIVVTAANAPDVGIAVDAMFGLITDRVRGVKRNGAPISKLGDRRTCVYRFFNAANELLYVGISTVPAARRLQHKKCSSWFADAVSMTEQWFPTRIEALAAERAAIKNECPRYNVWGNTSIPVKDIDED